MVTEIWTILTYKKWEKIGRKLSGNNLHLGRALHNVDIKTCWFHYIRVILHFKMEQKQPDQQLLVSRKQATVQVTKHRWWYSRTQILTEAQARLQSQQCAGTVVDRGTVKWHQGDAVSKILLKGFTHKHSSFSNRHIAATVREERKAWWMEGGSYAHFHTCRKNINQMWSFFCLLIQIRQ